MKAHIYHSTGTGECWHCGRLVYDPTAKHISQDEFDKRKRANQARRDKHQALTSCGLKRVRGGLGGIYYE